MADNRLFDENELESLIDLVKILNDADPDEKLYNMSVRTSDNIMAMINDSSISDEEKKRLKGKFNKRGKNQLRVEELSKKAKDINRGEQLLKGKSLDVDMEK